MRLNEFDLSNKVGSLKNKAGLGDANAQNSLGIMYRRGEGGFQKDFFQAFEMFKRSAEKGNMYGQQHLASMLRRGQGCTQDFHKAFEMYQRSAEQGNVRSQFHLGRFYAKGLGCTKDIKKATELYMRSAEQGNASAQCNLGKMYHLGEGCPKDETKAFEMYQKSAAQGKATALFNLGLMYRDGKGCSKDLRKAYDMFKTSAAKGFNKAIKELQKSRQLFIAFQRDDELAGKVNSALNDGKRKKDVTMMDELDLTKDDIDVDSNQASSSSSTSSSPRKGVGESSSPRKYLGESSSPRKNVGDNSKLSIVKNWTVDDVACWFKSLSLSQDYTEMIVTAHLTGRVLLLMRKKEDWKELGMTVFGDIHLIVNEVANM